MFSKLRKNHSDKSTQPPKLRGMPALKQMRSSRREETLKNGSILASLSELEKQAMVNGKEAIRPTTADVDRQKSQQIAITPNYKRSTSPDSGHHSSGSRQANHVDRIACANGSTFLFYGDKTPGITQDIPEVDEYLEDGTTSVNSPWRISKGDSGYKSKDDEKPDSKNKKQKRSRKKSNGKQSNCGLHQVKQQRKASREGVSMSMRALTPKERESIQCLEDVLKNHPGGDESHDEVFDSDPDQGIENEAEMIFLEVKERVEAIDHGYASVNDISRKYSVESVESVGSIIDLVGNLSSSPSSQTSPVYSAVAASIDPSDVVQVSNHDAFLDKFSSMNSHDEGIQHEDEAPFSDDVIVLPDEAISHLDDVINSFNFESDHGENEDEEKSSVNREFGKAVEIGLKEPERRKKSLDMSLVTGKGSEGSDSRGERKKKKKTKRYKSRDSASDGEKEKRRRDGHKGRDSETERERKERKKQRKEEKRKKRKEISESEDEARRREENIARHVDEISTLTQNMIITAQKNNEIEPIYAQVKKPKKKKDINGNLKIEDMKPLEEVVPDPPSPFANPTLEELESERQRILDQTPEKQDDFSKFRLTSTPVSSNPTRERAYTSIQDEVLRESHKVPGPKRPASDSLQHANYVQPYLSASSPQVSGRLYVSPSMLKDSSQNLRPLTASGPQVLHIDPCRNSINKAIYETASPPSAFRDHPISRLDPKRSSDPPKQEKVQRRPPRVTHNLRPGRPVSLNLEDNAKIGSLLDVKRGKHSSFREEKSAADQGQKARPFVIRTTKKPIELC